jgi:uncharacterized protein with NAD-binding domain and iron-sulfur cluster
MIKEKVIVIGGGVGGLTAAHELIERDFDVEVYERHDYLGGKAASRRDASNLPTEHGFRFFPSWYRNLTDTLGRIPCRGGRGVRSPSNVEERLIPVHRGLLAFYAREPMPWVTHVPRSTNQARIQANFFGALSNAGLSPSEVALVGRKLAQFFATPDAMRVQLYEGVTWWDYMECEGKSAIYQTLIAASTRLMVAAQPKDASAYTIGRLAQRTISDAWTTVDRVLDGPTSEVWMDLWVEDLRGSGVKFSLGWELSRIVFCPGDDEKEECGGECDPGPSGGSLNVISHVVMSRVTARYIDSLRTVVASLRAFLKEQTPSDPARQALKSCEQLAAAVLADGEWKHAVTAALAKDAARARDQGTGPAKGPKRGASRGQTGLAGAHLALYAIRESAKKSGSTREFVDNLRPWLSSPDRAFNGTETEIWPWNGNRDIAPPGELEEALGARFGIPPGKAAGTAYDRARDQVAVLQTFATILADVSASEFARPKTVKGQYFVFALPVEQMAYYANRTTAMTFHDPTMRNLLKLMPYTSWMSGIQFYLNQPCHLVEGHLLCMDTEWSLTAIEQTQFWDETDLTLKGNLQGEKIRAVLSVDISTWTVPGRFVPREAFNCTRDEIAREVWGQLKASVRRLTKSTQLRDDMLLGGPKLQAGVNFNLDANLADIYDAKKQAEYEKSRGLDVDLASSTTYELPYIAGVTREFNAEPMLLSGPGSRALRPDARTAIDNMFLSADYIRTDTDLACMEGANEAGRRAANAVLQASGSLHAPVQVWTLSMARDALAAVGRLFGEGKGAFELAAQSARTAGHLVDSLLGVTGLTRLRSSRNGNEPR